MSAETDDEPDLEEADSEEPVENDTPDTSEDDDHLFDPNNLDPARKVMWDTLKNEHVMHRDAETALKEAVDDVIRNQIEGMYDNPEGLRQEFVRAGYLDPDDPDSV